MEEYKELSKEYKELAHDTMDALKLANNLRREQKETLDRFTCFVEWVASLDETDSITKAFLIKAASDILEGK